ncbi:MAG: hypothetical protein GY847_28410 [Proteobacteria bacterium]|nr:hypothetical protein [Pseudomonadota bacterium]
MPINETTIICWNCGITNTDEAEKCSGCGETLTIPIRMRQCPKCGESIPATSLSCVACREYLQSRKYLI